MDFDTINNYVGVFNWRHEMHLVKQLETTITEINGDNLSSADGTSWHMSDERKAQFKPIETLIGQKIIHYVQANKITSYCGYEIPSRKIFVKVLDEQDKPCLTLFRESPTLKNELNQIFNFLVKNKVKSIIRS